MNKKISELALRSYVVVGDYSHCESVLNPEKFVKLIIDEIVNLNYNDDKLTTVQKVAFENKLRKHFGLD